MINEDRLRDLLISWRRDAAYLRDGTATPVGEPGDAMAAQADAHAQQLQDVLDGVEFD